MVEGAAITFRHTGYYIIVMILISRRVITRNIKRAYARRADEYKTHAAIKEI